MLDKILSNFDKNQSVPLNNLTCTYCGAELTEDNNSKEHVIGRKFVPKGSFDNQWNLIVQVCKSCNGKKSDLENDISAITLEQYSRFNSERLQSAICDAKRKAENCVSRQTGVKVKNSCIESSIDLPLSNNANLNLKLKGPAQLDETRCFELARYHLMAFFYFLTFKEKTKKGGFWQEGYHPAFQAHYQDWGNDELVSFMTSVNNWEPRWRGITANEFFKCIIRKHPKDKCWAWALEWNKSYRLVGFFGCRITAQKIVDEIPQLQWKTLKNLKNQKQFYREEKTLARKDDILFTINNA